MIKVTQSINCFLKPTDSWSFSSKTHFLRFLRFSAWKWATLAPIHSKWHLQCNDMPFFPLASLFMTFLLRHVRKWPTSSGFSIFKIFFVPFLFRLFLAFCCSDWPSTVRTGLASSSKKFWESIIETCKFYHGVAMCSCRQFCSWFFTPISDHFCGYCISLWSGYHW